MKDIRKIVSDNIKHYRKIKNISQEQLAFLTGLHRTYISSVECKNRNISIESLSKIAESLEVEPYKLLVERTNEDE